MEQRVGPHGIRGAEGHESMIAIEIASLVFGGVLLFLIFVALALQGPPRTAADSSAISAVGQMVALQGVSFAGAKRLLDDAEFQMLRSSAQLRDVAKHFRKERKALALLWISLLRGDVLRLWRFRRFLANSGVPTTMGEELHILSSAVLAMGSLSLLWVVVYTAGPFALTSANRRAHRMVETMSYTSAQVLNRLPRTGWPELQRNWQKSVA